MAEIINNSFGLSIIRKCPILLILVGVITLFGCAAVGPDYIQPQVELPKQWHTDTANTKKTNSQGLSRWWEKIEDPMLTRLMERAVSGNPDARKAQSRIREARYQLTAARSSLFPTLDSSGSARKSGSRGDSQSQGENSELFSAGLDAGWEVDIFGSNQRSDEASRADVEAQIEDFYDVMVTLTAEVALNYIDLRTTQTRLAVANKNVAAQQETWELLATLSAAGGGDELAVAQARYNLESSRTKIPDLKAQIEAAMNRLAVLVGQPAGILHNELSLVTPIPQVSIELAVGVPTDVIRQRPDIRSAERNLAAQTARTGEAISEKFPKFTLSGSIGLEALSIEKLFSSPTRVWSLGPSISWPLFNAGAVGSNIKTYEERQEQALIQYKSTILSAVEEVENALVAYAMDHEKLNCLKVAADAAQFAAQLAEYQYSTGMTDFSDVLDAQRSLLSFEDQLAEISGALLSDFVRLYKSLGGGWQSYSTLVDFNMKERNKG